MTTTGPQDAAVYAGAPQDAPHGWSRPGPADVPRQDDPFQAGWYPSPDGSPTLSWWTGKGWSRTQQPIPATRQPTLTGRVALSAGWYPSPDGSPTLSWWTGKGWSRAQQPIPATRQPTLTDRVVRQGPPPSPPGPPERGRDRPKSYLRAVLLTTFLGPFGLIWVKWQLAVVYFILAAPLSAFVGHWTETAMLARPVSVVLAILAVAWHNHRVGLTPRRPTLRPPGRRRSARRQWGSRRSGLAPAAMRHRRTKAPR